MILHDVWQKSFSFFQKPVVVEPSDERLTSDAGLLPIRQFDEQLGLTRRFTEQLHDSRIGGSHTQLEMVRSRVFGILAGYEDQNDHDALRSDPAFKLIAGRAPDAPDLASQPTLSRFENSITPGMLLNLETWFITEFASSFEQVPNQLTLDVDTFDDPVHGHQQLTFFHGYYEQYQYQVRVVTCAENDQVVLPTLLYGTARPTLSLDDDVPRIVNALRERNPDVQIHLRGDSGNGEPMMYQTSEALRIDYTFGLKMNPRLQKMSEECLQTAVFMQKITGEPQRMFEAFEYQAASWDRPRWVIVKCEANEQGTNRRAIVTNRPGGRVCPQGAYESYADRGESENRNKELKCELKADRLSDHRFMANCFRMFLHCLAANLLVRLRQILPEPMLPELNNEAPRGELAREALPEQEKRRGFNHRRRADPLGEGHACTWRLMLIKVAAKIVVRARRVVVRLCGSWPFLHFYRNVSDAILALRSPPAPETS